MSHFTLQFDRVGGPLLSAIVTVSDARQKALEALKQPVPSPVPIRAMVDTGASCTCIDPEILTKSLALTPTGEADCLTPTTGAIPQKRRMYDVGLRIFAASATDPQLYIDPLSVMDSELFAGQGIHALVGRDVLAKCVLNYNGVIGLFTLAF